MNNYEANEQTNEKIAQRNRTNSFSYLLYPKETNFYNLVIHNNDGTMTKLCRTKRVAEVELYEYVLDNWSRIYESGDMSDEKRETWDKLTADGVPYPLLDSDPLNSIGFYFELTNDKQEIQIVTFIVDETFDDVDNTPQKQLREKHLREKNIRAGTVCDPTFLELAATDGS